VGSFSLSGSGSVAYAFHAADDLAQLYLREASGESRKITDSNRDLLRGTKLAETVSVEFLSFDGIKVEGFLTLPRWTGRRGCL
jgi:dipeptidyl aminopeptidase/acylaminoacyl peptidase